MHFNIIKLSRFLLSLVLFFTFCSSISQTQHYASSKLTVAVRKPDKNLEWLDEGAEEVNIDINILPNCVEIISAKKQEYSLISVTKNTKDLKIWYCRDSDGVLCNVYFINSSDTPLITYIAVEFDDVAWYYTCFKI